jgi:hypothetical protein
MPNQPKARFRPLPASTQLQHALETS